MIRLYGDTNSAEGGMTGENKHARSGPRIRSAADALTCSCACLRTLAYAGPAQITADLRITVHRNAVFEFIQPKI
jgi:hypothetical protein